MAKKKNKKKSKKPTGIFIKGGGSVTTAFRKMGPLRKPKKR